MNTVHFEECVSTQAYLKDLLQNREGDFRPILVTTQKQTGGMGRSGNSWIQFHSAMAYSFSFVPGTVLTLTSLEIAVGLSNYFQECLGQMLFLKWPNDLFNMKGEKVGGIITHFVRDQLLAVGVGLNLVKEGNEKQYEKLASSCPYPIGFIFERNSQIPSHHLPISDLCESSYHYLLKHRLSPAETIEKWNEKCIHLHQEVLFLEDYGSADKAPIQGTFLGLGPLGEARIKTAAGERTFYSGHLRYVLNQ